MHHTEQILPVRHDDNLMLFRPQPEQLDFIVLFSLVVLGFGVVAILVAAAAAANPVLDAVADAVSVFGRVAVGRRRMGQRVTQGGCAGHKGVDVRRQGFSLAGPVRLLLGGR